MTELVNHIIHPLTAKVKSIIHKKNRTLNVLYYVRIKNKVGIVISEYKVVIKMISDANI